MIKSKILRKLVLLELMAVMSLAAVCLNAQKRPFSLLPSLTDEVEEDYIKDQNVLTYPSDTTIIVPDGCVYVMGDNRNASKDSRDATVGPIPVYKIIGKMWKSS